MPGSAPRYHQTPAAEGEAKRNVYGTHHQALGHADLATFLVQDTEIEDQKPDHDRHEGEPHPGRLAQKIREQEIEIHGSTSVG